ncbi:MAG: toprim domain-containing protein [Planctomycetota bacterium]
MASSQPKPRGRRGRDWIDFDQLKAQLTLEAVLTHHDIELRGSGDQRHGFCPLPTHTGSGRAKRSPSFSANLGKNAWQCFGCGAKGNALELAVRLAGFDPDDKADFRRGCLAVRDAFGLAEAAADDENAPTRRKPPATSKRRSTATSGAKERVEKEETESSVKTVANAPLDFTLQHLDPSHPYLRERGFTEVTIEHFGLGFCSRGLMKDRIAIPIHSGDGQLVAYAGRLVDDEAVDADTPKYRFPGPREKDGKRFVFHKSRLLYNQAGLAEDGDLVIVEGFADCWWLHQQGHTRVIALMGSSISDEQAEIVLSGTKPTARIVFMPDGDDAGTRCATELFDKLGKHRWCRWLKLPDGTQPTDYTSEQLRKLW